MKILSEIELQKLSTKRLLALYKKVRKELREIELTEEASNEVYEMKLKVFIYKDDIKQILNTREDVHGGKI
jgi:hypothetical protein